MMSTTTRLAALISLVLPLVSANISFNSSFSYAGANTSYADLSISPDSGVSEACQAAYAKSLSCSEWLIMGLDQSGDGPSEEDKFSEKTLDDLCTTQCIDGLLEWRDEVRSDCTKDDAMKAAGQSGQVLAAVTMANISFVEYLYWPTCLRDLSTGTLCYLANDTDTWASSDASENTPENISTFCDSSCLTQVSVFTWDIVGAVYGDSADAASDINIADATKICPKLDTSKFPFLHESASGSSSSSSSSSSSGNGTAGAGGSNSTSGNGTVIADTNAAGALRAGSVAWGLGSAVVAVVVGFGML